MAITGIWLGMKHSSGVCPWDRIGTFVNALLYVHYNCKLIETWDLAISNHQWYSILLALLRKISMLHGRKRLDGCTLCVRMG
jgi:hypothetical protein